jgi:hypothetical protein
MLAHPQRHAQHAAAGAKRIRRHPVDEFAQLRLEGRDVELGLDIPHAVVEPGIGLPVLRPGDPGRHSRPQRHGHEVAGRNLNSCRHAIGVGLVKGDRNEDIDDVLGHNSRPIRALNEE